MKFVELFAGIGGFRLGLETLGHQCVFASEIDKYAIQTYKANFGHAPTGDITKIQSKAIPKHDILTAGFPCQPFSMAGNRQGFDDTKGTLFFEILRILKDLRPKYFILENVRGLLSHDFGQTFKTITHSLYNLGYGIDYKILNSKDFGLAQSRQRIFIVGHQGQDVLWRINWPVRKHKRQSVLDIMEKDVKVKHLAKLENIKWIEPRGSDIINLGIVGKGGQGQRIYSPKGISPTLSLGGSRGSGLFFLLDDGRVRSLTPTECAKLQGFPATIKLPVSDTQAYIQFGNAVSVPVVKAVAEALLKS